MTVVDREGLLFCKIKWKNNMRIHLKIGSEGKTVPFNHQKMLTGVMHKWMGEENLEHGNISLYSFSMLAGGKKNIKGDGLIFEQGTSFFFSAYNNMLIQEIVKAIQKDPVMFNGLTVREIIIQKDPVFANKETFHVASPVFIKRKRDDGSIKHYKYNEKESSEFLTETLQSKLAEAGLEDKEATIAFDSAYNKAKTKVVHYNGIKNLANICPVIIQGKPGTKAFAWNVGIGNSTGIGFGAIK